MPNIKPVSDLRNYNEILKDIGEGSPVFLTKNGRGKFAIIDIAEYEKNQATIKLLTKLMKAKNNVKTEDDWLTEEQVKEKLGLWCNALDVVRKIIGKYEMLKEFPLMGAVLSSKINIETDFRYLISDNYLIFYNLDNEFVYIYRILYSGRDYLRILFSNEIS